MSSSVEEFCHKTSECRALAGRIEFSGVSAMPCQTCWEKGVVCKFLYGYKKYNHCMCSGKPCSGLSVAVNHGSSLSGVVFSC